MFKVYREKREIIEESPEKDNTSVTIIPIISVSFLFILPKLQALIYKCFFLPFLKKNKKKNLI